MLIRENDWSCVQQLFSLSLLALNPQLCIHQHEHVMKMDQTVLIIHLRVQNLRTFNEIDKHNHGTAWNW